MFTTVIFKWSLLHPTSNVPRTHFLVLSLLLFLCSPTWHHVSFVTCSEDRTFPFDAFPYLLCWRSTKPTHQCPDIFYCQSWILFPLLSLLGCAQYCISPGLLDRDLLKNPLSPYSLHLPYSSKNSLPQTHSCFWKSDYFLIGNQEPKKQTKTLSSWSPVVIVCELSCS